MTRRRARLDGMSLAPMVAAQPSRDGGAAFAILHGRSQQTGALMNRTVAVAACLVLTRLGVDGPATASAQSTPVTLGESPAALARDSLADQVSVTRPLTGAVIGSAAGFLVGGITGGYIGGNRCIDPGASDTCDWLRGMAVGTVVGVTLGAPVGATLFNNRQGARHWSLLASAAIAGAGIAAFHNVGDDPTSSSRNNKLYAIMIGVPVLQILSSTWIEVHTSRK